MGMIPNGGDDSGHTVEAVPQERPEKEPADEGPQQVLAVGPLQTVAQAVALRSFILTGIFLLALFHTLRVARDLFLPLMLAFFLTFLLSPLLRMLKRAHIPEAVGAALLLVVLVGGVGLGLYSLVTPATEWIAKAPDSMTRIQGRLRTMRFRMEQMNRTADQVERTIAGDSGTAPVSAVKSPAWIKQALFGGTTAFVSEAIVVIVLLYFLLASGDLFLRKLIKVLPTFKDKKRAVEIAREMENNISTYLFTVTLINVGVGVAVAVGVWLLKMPNPVLWGVLAFLLSYIPYLGALVGIGTLFLAALLVFDDLGHTLAVPGVYVLVTFVEANFVTPLVLARRLTLNPVVVFVGLLFWFFLWGIPGALLAVPTLAVFKIVCDHVDTLAPIGEFFGPAAEG
jgi:predicted PurR-regulated permease PerM